MMILLDTNVLSEAMRPQPAPPVIRWLNETDTSELFLSSITIAEITFGLRVMADASRQTILRKRFDELVQQGFRHNILSFDETAARAYGEIMGQCRSIGKAMSVLDGQISAIASIHNLALATRNIRDFEGIGLELLDPWVT